MWKQLTDLYGDGGGGGHEEEGGEGQSEHLESAAEKNALIDFRQTSPLTAAATRPVVNQGACYVRGLVLCGPQLKASQGVRNRLRDIANSDRVSFPNFYDGTGHSCSGIHHNRASTSADPNPKTG